MDVPVLCWCCTITPAISEQEFVTCHDAVVEAWPDSPFVQRLKDMPRNFDTFRDLLAQIMPLLMMRQQRVPRTKWTQFQTERGKKWIEKNAEGMHPSKHLTSMMGYTTSWDANMIVMAAAQGKRHQVVNIGLNVKRISADSVPVTHWAQSQQHKLTPLEASMLTGLPDDKLLSRIIILLTIKESLINGLGQPVGFDLSRIEVNVPEGWLRVDGQPLLGWEFRLFRAQQECIVGDVHFMEQYQITVAFYRGNNISKFVFIEKPQEIERLTQYFPFDNLVKVIPKLLQDS